MRPASLKTYTNAVPQGAGPLLGKESAMLSLQLKSGEYLTIGDDIVVQVFDQGGSFRVAVKAPREMTILRGEVRERAADRPDGLLSQRNKTPSERRRNERRMEELARRRSAD